MNPFEFVLAVLFIVFMFGLLRHRMGVRHRWERSETDQRETEENARLQQQVKQLQDRIHVLERIVTARGVETAAQIEALRERDHIGAEDKA
jgi:uncharacterized protein YlxW (UPF0749 family)